jgi:hypothetical protein
VSERHGKVPPLFWITNTGSGLPMSVTIAGRRVICFFSLEITALQYAEHYLGGESGLDWYAVGPGTPEALYRMAEGAPQQGFDGWLLNPPPGAGGERRLSSWSELRDEVERSLDVTLAFDEAEREENPDRMAPNDWQELPSDPETAALGWLLPPATEILEGPSSPLKMPPWVETFARDRRRIELSGREGAETLDAWRAQTEEKIAALLALRPWGLLHVLALLRRLPNDQYFLGERTEEAGLRRFDPYQAEVTERAALKYARWDASGMKLDAWEPGMEGLAQEMPAVDERRLAEILSLLQLGGAQLAYLEKIRRGIVHGNTVILRPDGVSDSRPEPWLLRRLVLHDARTRRFSFLGETAGVFDTSNPDDPEAGGMLASEAVRTTYREDEGRDWWRYDLSRRLIRKRDKRFAVSRARGLGPAYEYLKLLEEEVTSQYGLTPELIVAALSAVQKAVEQFVFPEGTTDTLLETFAERIAYLDRRGYLIVRDDVVHDVILGLWAASPGVPRNIAARGS